MYSRQILPLLRSLLALSSSACLLAACSGDAPSASFSLGASATVGKPTAFDATASSSVRSYRWDFGDGAHGSGAQLAHVFTKPGTYAVVLTVSSDGGDVATVTHDVTVADLPAGVPTPVVGMLVDAGGAPLAGVTAAAGTVSATSDANGRVTLSLESGRVHALSLTKSGFATQIQRVDLTLALTAWFSTKLLPREPMQPLDAATGGTLHGRDGSTIILPADALDDPEGHAVTGMVGVAITPIDVTAPGQTRGFPGEFLGVRTDATTSQILSYGTVEYALMNGEQRLQLRPGKTALIEVPTYAGQNRDGSQVRAGDSFPLWALDEQTGSWVEEGSGTVVESATSPTGFALRGEVTHFSWWNHDAPWASNDTELSCKCESDAAICAMFGKAAYTCHIYGDQGVFHAAPPPAMTPPVTARTIDIVGTTKVAMPTDIDLIVTGSAFAGSFTGSAPLHVAPNSSGALEIALKPALPLMTVADEDVTLPVKRSFDVDRGFTRRRYKFSLPLGSFLAASYAPEPGAAAGIRLLDSNGAEVAVALADSKAGAFTVTTSSSSFVLELIQFTTGKGTLDIRIGTTTDERITVPYDASVVLEVGDTHRYTFASEAGAEYDLKWDPTPGNQGSLTLTAPGATELYASTALDTKLDKMFTATAAGDYVVALKALVPVTGTLHIVKLKNGPGPGDGGDDGGGGDIVPINLPFNQQFPSTMGVKRFGFTATAGTGAIVKAIIADAATPIVRVKSPGGTVLVEAPFATGAKAYFPVYCETAGTYVVEVDPLTATNDFSLQIDPITDITAIPFNDRVGGTITGTTGTKGYVFDATANDVVRLSQSRDCSQFNGDPLFQTIAAYAEGQSSAKITTTGKQLIAIRKVGGANCGGQNDFFVTVRKAVPITLGTPTAMLPWKTVAHLPSIQSFTFNAAAGTIIAGKATGSTYSYFYPQVYVQGPIYGTYTFVPNPVFSNAVGPWTLTTSGTQIIDVDVADLADASITDGVFRLFSVAAPVAVATPTTSTGVTVQAGEHRFWSFSSSDAWAAGKTTFTIALTSDDATHLVLGKLTKAVTGMPFTAGTALGNTSGARGTVSGSIGPVAIDAATTYYLEVVSDTAANGVPDPTVAVAAHWVLTASP